MTTMGQSRGHLSSDSALYSTVIVHHVLFVECFWADRSDKNPSRDEGVGASVEADVSNRTKRMVPNPSNNQPSRAFQSGSRGRETKWKIPQVSFSFMITTCSLSTLGASRLCLLLTWPAQLRVGYGCQTTSVAAPSPDNNLLTAKVEGGQWLRSKWGHIPAWI